MSGQGTVDVSDNGRPLKTVDRRRHPEALHAVLRHRRSQTGVLTLTFSPGVQAYDFTFG